MYAPYFETWTRTTIDGLARRSGMRYFTLATIWAIQRDNGGWPGRPRPPWA